MIAGLVRLRDHELEALRAHTASVEAEVEALRSSPLRGPTAWLRRHASRARR